MDEPLPRATSDDRPEADGGDAVEFAADPLTGVRARLDDVLDLPLPDRADVFEDAHRVVVAELRALELG